jgi:Protein of unknown function (DUF1385)
VLLAHEPVEQRGADAFGERCREVRRAIGGGIEEVGHARIFAPPRYCETVAERLKLGGMALRNGLFVHGPTHWAAAVRGADGEIHVAAGRKRPPNARLARVPIARGVLRLSEMIAILPQLRRALPDARLAFENPAVIALSASTMALTSGARRRGVPPATVEALASVLAVLPAVAMLRSSGLARYHGAEHKTIGAYESGGEASDTAKEHDRCGSHLVAPMLALSIAGNVLASKVRRGRQPLLRTGASLAAMGVAVEAFGWAARHGSHPLARAFRAPGDLLQRTIGTREPSADELAVARAALDRLLTLEG